MTPTPETQVLQANSTFTTNLYSILARAPGNLCFSPLSLHACLSILHQGAQDKTLHLLAEILKIPDARTTAEGYKSAIGHLNAIEDVTVILANKIYGNGDKGEFLQQFQDCVSANFRSEVELLDLKDPKAAASIVNKWVQQKTMDKIKNIVQERDMDRNLRLILVNAIYFKGEWASKFREEATRASQFFISVDETIEVKMMHQKGKYGYKDDDQLGAQIIEIPYKGFSVNMVVILPKETQIEELEAKLGRLGLDNIGHNLKLTDVHLYLPKFKIEETIKLRDVLSEMGLRTIFDPKSANFKGIANASGLEDNICVSDAIQKVFIECNEGGTVAAAATRMGLVLGAAPGQPKPVVFKVDRPAIFMLLANHKDQRSILFYGRLSRPQFP